MNDPNARTSLTVEGGLAQLRLIRVAGRNGIDMAMVESLGAHVEQIAADSSVRAVLIGADGPAFTVGGDLRYLDGQLDRLPDELQAMISSYHRTLGLLARLPVPVVVAARGAVAGGGLGLLWCADLAIASDDLRIATGFAQLALSGDGGSSWHLPRLVGLRRAQELILGGRVLDAAEALDWGLVTRVVPVDDLEDLALGQARALAQGPTYGLGRMKQLLLESSTNSYPEQLAAEQRAIVACARTDDAREGITAFGARRPPKFVGH